MQTVEQHNVSDKGIVITQYKYGLETGIPIPPKAKKVAGKASYPFPLMKANENSFLVPADGTDEKELIARVQQSCRTYKKKEPSWEFSVDGVFSDDKKTFVGVRCWRTK